MSRTTAYDAHTVATVTRTLRAVAEATPVGPPGASEGGADTEGPAGLDGLDAFGSGRAVPPPLPPAAGRRRGGRARRATAAAAAALAAAAAVVAGVSVTRSGDGDPAPPTQAVPRAGLQLAATWLPDDLIVAEPVFTVPDSGIDLEGAVLRAPDRTGAVLAAVSTSAEDRPAVPDYIAALAADLGTLFGHRDIAPVYHEVGGHRGVVVTTRGTVDAELVTSIGDRLRAGTAPGDPTLAPAGWSTQAVALDWVPGVAPTRGTRYGNGEDGRGGGEVRYADVMTVDGDLPAPGALDAVLTGATRTTAGGRDGWLAELPHTGQRLFLWQEEPGVVGAVEAYGLSDEELTYVVEGLRFAPPPSPGNSSILTSGEVSGLQYALRWDATVAGMGESPCLTFVVNGADDRVSCGMSAGVTDGLGMLATAAVTDDVALVWGWFGPNVRYVDGSDGSSAETLPVEPEAPDGLRYAVVEVARPGDPTVTFDLLASSGEVLDTVTHDVSNASEG